MLISTSDSHAVLPLQPLGPISPSPAPTYRPQPPFKSQLRCPLWGFLGDRVNVNRLFSDLHRPAQLYLLVFSRVFTGERRPEGRRWGSFSEPSHPLPPPIATPTSLGRALPRPRPCSPGPPSGQRRCCPPPPCGGPPCRRSCAGGRGWRPALWRRRSPRGARGRTQGPGGAGGDPLSLSLHRQLLSASPSSAPRTPPRGWPRCSPGTCRPRSRLLGGWSTWRGPRKTPGLRPGGQEVQGRGWGGVG